MSVMTGASNPDGIKQKPSFSRKREFIESEDYPFRDPHFRWNAVPGVELPGINPANRRLVLDSTHFADAPRLPYRTGLLRATGYQSCLAFR